MPLKAGDLPSPCSPASQGLGSGGLAAVVSVPRPPSLAVSLGSRREEILFPAATLLCTVRSPGSRPAGHRVLGRHRGGGHLHQGRVARERRGSAGGPAPPCTACVSGYLDATASFRLDRLGLRGGLVLCHYLEPRLFVRGGFVFAFPSAFRGPHGGV